MANQITLGATLLFDGGDGTGGSPVDLAGTANGTADTSTFLQGSTSYTYSFSNSRDGSLYNAGSAQDYSSNVFYITVNSGVVGLLTDFRIRFCGATVTDFFEVEVGSSTSWPTSINGGWVTFVVDIEEAKADAGRITGGTEPATNAIQYVGFSLILSTMPKMADNTWFDTLYRLPANTAAVIVEGQDQTVSAHDWDEADILAQLGSGQMFYYQGAGGSYVLTGPIQFGINDTTTHGFTATNAVWLWDDQTYVADGFYGLSALGNVGGTTNVSLGSKSGTGDDATGAQGLTISAAPTGARWAMDFNDPNLDLVGFYGCSLQHGGDFLLDDLAVSFISTIYLDCGSALVTGSEQLRCKVLAPNVLAGVPFFTADEMDNIVFCEFESNGVGHAIELVTPIDASQISKGNLFSGYDVADPGTANDKAVYNNQAGAIVISNTNGGNLTEDFHVRNGTSATTDVQANISTTLTGMKDNTEVRVYDQSNPPVELAGIENATAGSTDDRSFTFALSATTLVDIVIFNVDWILPPNNRIDDFTVPSVDSSLPISQVFDRNFENP